MPAARAAAAPAAEAAWLHLRDWTQLMLTEACRGGCACRVWQGKQLQCIQVAFCMSCPCGLCDILEAEQVRDVTQMEAPVEELSPADA